MRTTFGASLLGLLLLVAQGCTEVTPITPTPIIQSGMYPHPLAISETPLSPSHVLTFTRGGPEESFVDRIQSFEIRADEIATEMVLIFMLQGESPGVDVSPETEAAADDMERLCHELMAFRPPPDCRDLKMKEQNILRGSILVVELAHQTKEAP